MSHVPGALLHFAVVSDIHLGHKRNSTAEIVKNLRRAFPDNSETGQLDIIFLAGDVFDSLLSLPDEDIFEIDAWVCHFLRVAKKWDIKVRVLEGTPGHDWKQSERFVIINEVVGIEADLKYVKDLSIEYIEQYGATVLYVPDEWQPTTEKTLSQVKELLLAKGLTQVDYAIMHGQFEYQLPPHVPGPKHSSKEYLALVRELIFIGHVHIHTRLERIVAQGSFDRLAHGEEGPKGHVRALVHAPGEHTVTFVENASAKRFVTIDCSGLDTEATIALVDQYARDIPDDSYVRLRGELGQPIFDNMELLIRRYPLYTWSKQVLDPNQDPEEIKVESENLYVPITLTKENLGEILVERVVNSGATAQVVDAARIILEEVL